MVMLRCSCERHSFMHERLERSMFPQRVVCTRGCRCTGPLHPRTSFRRVLRFQRRGVVSSDTIVNDGRGTMHDDEDEFEDTPRLSQDMIPTVAPPKRQGHVAEREDDVPTIQPAPRLVEASSPSSDAALRAESPDDVPTERPVWTDPVESREQLQPGVEPPAQKREA